MTSTAVAAEAPEAASRPPEPSRPVTSRALPAALYALATLPVVNMVVEVLKAPRLHFLDYWSILLRVAAPDGSLRPQGVLTYQNEHPTFLPGLVIWLEARFLGGSNRTLGLVAVALAVATVVLLAAMLPARIGPAKRAALTAVFAFLLISPHGLHNFTVGMSGLAWLSANVACVAALLAASRRRFAVAIALGLLGCACYGTAFAVWPALALTLWLCGERRWKAVVPLVIGLGIVAAWALTYNGLESGPESDGGGPEGILSTLLTVVGALWASGARNLAVVAGAVTLAALGAMAVAAVRSRLGRADAPWAADGELRAVAPWVGVAVYAIGACVMIAMSRTDQGLDSSLAGRYASLPGLACAALLALAVLYFDRLPIGPLVAAGLVVALATFALGAPSASSTRSAYPKQDTVAVALQVGAERAVADLRFPADAATTMRSLGGYPFNGDFTLGCGGVELGDRIDPRVTPGLSPPPGVNGSGGYIDDVGEVAGAWRASGWALVDGRHAECVVVVETDGLVVGGGGVGIRRPDLVSAIGARDALGGWMVVAPATDGDLHVLVKSGDRFYRVSARPQRG